MSFKSADVGAERVLLGTIISCGPDALIDSETYLSASDLTLGINKVIFTCLKSLAEEDNCKQFDIETLKLKAKALGLGGHLEDKKSQEYLSFLESMRTEKENIPIFSAQIRKYSIIRDLYKRYEDGKKYLEGITGNESLSEIISNAENKIVDYISGYDTGESLTSLCSNIEDYFENLMSMEIVDQVGYPTGFPRYDLAIGGGPRRGTFNLTAARSSVGKSWLCLNQGINIARQGIPVLYLDTELVHSQQQPRLTSVISGIPIFYLENGQFRNKQSWVQDLKNAKEEIKHLNIDHKSVAGMSVDQALGIAKNWLVRKVGFREDGTANDCVIIFDYLKLCSAEGLDKTPEFILLGIAANNLSNFAIKYNVPIISAVQLNRAGITQEDQGIISGSDRILFLASSVGVLRDKDASDYELEGGKDFGGKKLSIMKARYGAGFADSDYLSIKSELKPDVTIEKGTGRMKESLTFSEIAGNPQ